LQQENLARTMFPVGQFHKPHIRQMAVDMGYPELAKKAESYEICFIPDNDYRGFLSRRVEGLEKKVNGGNFVLADGTVVGQHRGYPFYTIGQRRGLGIALGEPMYVTRIVPESNTVILGQVEDLNLNGMLVRNINMVKYPDLGDGMDSVVKIRSQHSGAPAFVEKDANSDMVKATFKTRVDAIAPGQSAVFYDGDDVIGGGHIWESFEVE
ncbi:MAG: tRNA methyl transferase PRC-barrel domain-containing protein, partial [Chitinophagales bacterium]